MSGNCLFAAEKLLKMAFSFQWTSDRQRILDALFSSAAGEQQPMITQTWISCFIDFGIHQYTGSRNLSEVNAIDALIGRQSCATLKRVQAVALCD